MAEPITDSQVPDTGAQALPDSPPTEPAANPDPAQVPNSTEGANTALPSEDEKLVKFAESHGITLDSESAKKAAKIAMDNQASFQQAQQKASQAEKDLQARSTHDGSEAGRLAALEQEIAINKFKTSHPDWEQHTEEMNKVLNEPYTTRFGTFSRQEYVDAGLLSLDDIYYAAKARTPSKPQEDTTQVLQSIVNKQLAGSAPGNAVNSAPPSGTTDPILEGIKRSRE